MPIPGISKSYEDLNLTRNFRLDDIDTPKKTYNDDDKVLSNKGLFNKVLSNLEKKHSIEKADEFAKLCEKRTEAYGKQDEEKFTQLAAFTKRITLLTEIAAKKNIQLPTHNGEGLFKKSFFSNTDKVNSSVMNALTKEMGLSKDESKEFQKLTIRINNVLKDFCQLTPKDLYSPQKDVINEKAIAILDKLELEFNEMDDFLMKCINKGTGNFDAIDAKQEEFAVLHAQLRHVTSLCMEFQNYKSIEHGYAETASKTSASGGTLKQIEEELNPILKRLEAATEAVKEAPSIEAKKGASVNVTSIISEATKAIEALNKIKEINRDKMKADGASRTMPIRSEIDSYINLLNDKIIGLSNTVKKELGALRKELETMRNSVDPTTSPEDILIEDIFLREEIEALNEYIKNHKENKFIRLRPEDYADLLRGNINPGYLSVAYAKGLNGSHMQAFSGDTKINVVKKLGSGSFNAPLLCDITTTNPDGTKNVEQCAFKPGNASDIGFLRSGAAGSLFQATQALKSENGVYSKQPLIKGENGAIRMERDKEYFNFTNVNMMKSIKNNVAAYHMAKMLGTPDAITKASFAVVNGQHGILMSKAKGCEADKFDSHNVSYLKGSYYGKSAQANEIVNKFDRLDQDTRLKMMGDLLKGLNQMTWCDLLSGQADRHSSNYFVNFDFDKKEVSVTGIDNDVCCGHNLVGLKTLKIPKKTYFNTFKASDNELNEKRLDPAVYTIESEKESGYYRLDLTKLKGARLAKTWNALGIYNIQLPSVIDKTTYDKLIAINEDDYREQMKAILIDEDDVNAAVSRLKEAQDYAKKLNVIEAKKWNSEDFQKGLLNKEREETANRMGLQKLTGSTMNNISYKGQKGDFVGWSYYAPLYLRDFAFLVEHIGPKV